MRAVLAQFEITGAEPLGEGDEAVVYALDAARVLKVHKRRDPALLARRQSFYRTLAAQHLAIDFPLIDSIGEHEGACFTVERRLPGESLGPLLGNLAPAARRAALDAYFDAVEVLAGARAADFVAEAQRPYGDVLAAPPLRASTWTGFLRARLDQRLEQAAADLAADGLEVTELRIWFARALDALDPQPRPCLVHGDYWPPNVFVDVDVTRHVTAIVDFGSLTVVGDHLQDVAGAIVFLAGHPGVSAADLGALRWRAQARYGAAAAAAECFYRAYYGALFAIHKQAHPRAYAWSLRVLHSLACDQH